MKFIVTAEHTSGRSVGHSCTKGIYEDPTDTWQAEVAATDEDQAEHYARQLLSDVVLKWPTCDCHRKLQPGSSEWWKSVVFSVAQSADSESANGE